jgi:hypothetical protein
MSAAPLSGGVGRGRETDQQPSRVVVNERSCGAIEWPYAWGCDRWFHGCAVHFRASEGLYRLSKTPRSDDRRLPTASRGMMSRYGGGHRIKLGLNPPRTVPEQHITRRRDADRPREHALALPPDREDW